MSATIAPATSQPSTLSVISATLKVLHPTATCRIARAAGLVHADAVSRLGPIWIVRSQTTPGMIYCVIPVNDQLTCECQDYRQRGGPCKHVFSVVITQAAERVSEEPIEFELTEQAEAALALPPIDAA